MKMNFLRAKPTGLSHAAKGDLGTGFVEYFIGLCGRRGPALAQACKGSDGFVEDILEEVMVWDARRF